MHTEDVNQYWHISSVLECCSPGNIAIVGVNIYVTTLCANADSHCATNRLNGFIQSVLGPLHNLLYDYLNGINIGFVIIKD